MREIKFRGLDSNGVWRYGNLLQSSKFKDGRVDCWIQSKSLLCVGAASVSAQSFTQVDEKTVGQFIGIRSNGVEIYGGDITNDHVGIGQVKYSNKHGAFRVCYGDGMAKWFYDYNLKGERESIEVIGNIHQHPELLEKQS